MFKKKILKSKSGTVLTEALISLFILGTLFISVATATTVSITNTRRLQEVNETSTYAQKIADCIYSLSQSDSGAFFSEIERTYEEYISAGEFSHDCVVNLDTIAQELEYRESGGEKNILSLYDILNYDGADAGEEEMTQYSVKLYLLPTERAEVHKSVNYFTSYHPHLVDNADGGRIFNAEELDDLYTFKLVVSKTVNTIGSGTTDFTQSSPASVTYIFQISSNGGEQ